MNRGTMGPEDVVGERLTMQGTDVTAPALGARMSIEPRRATF